MDCRLRDIIIDFTRTDRMDAPRAARRRSREILLSMLSIFAQRCEQNVLRTASGIPVASTASTAMLIPKVAAVSYWSRDTAAMPR